MVKRCLLALAWIVAGMLLTLVALFFSFSKAITLDTRMELISCAVAAQDYRNAHGRWPESHGQIDSRTSAELGMGGGGRPDEWGRPFLFTVKPELDQAVLQTYGADGKSGTRDGELRVVVTPRQLTVFTE